MVYLRIFKIKGHGEDQVQNVEHRYYDRDNMSSQAIRYIHEKLENENRHRFSS